MKPEEFTGWWYTDATRQLACSKCGAAAGEYCRTPKGRATDGKVPHAERTQEIARRVGSMAPWQGNNSLVAWKVEQARIAEAAKP